MMFSFSFCLVQEYFELKRIHKLNFPAGQAANLSGPGGRRPEAAGLFRYPIM